ncbi:Response regulator of citrate/malate metabolism [Pseudarthrobacter enclensis]|uniref:Transcriptional regulatory protein n=1 Tax=Pseudarthrobacter enclensis TaxID=993070 RepID=A0A0V8IS23_9MICC|nr:response regulator [Pseudarthrobacter enclensis]KSU77562.1 two-component system response regulator [Pseudarthrobacter enclensis]SCB90665.1 Response regulator of citrate/malate metabolism [Pseudarthrobacter enclensis]
MPIDVLVVDDDYMVASVHARFVNRVPGFNVVGAAHSGQEALRLVASLNPQLVLLDIYLPDMNGTAVLQKLREEARDVDVLVITADDDTDTIRKAFRGGVLHYILKPFDEETLRDRLLHYADAVHGPLANRGESDQQGIDRMFGAPQTAGPRTPKSITAQTVTLVKEILQRHPEGLSSAQCAELSGLSRVSARRYLQHLANTGQAAVTLRYATAGRPERLFRPTPLSQ